MHTVPLGMVLEASEASPAVKRTVPRAATGFLRSSPRSWAWASRYSPSAVWGKACRTTQSAWIYSAHTWAARAYSRADRSHPSRGSSPVRSPKPASIS